MKAQAAITALVLILAGGMALAGGRGPLPQVGAHAPGDSPPAAAAGSAAGSHAPSAGAPSGEAPSVAVVPSAIAPDAGTAGDGLGSLELPMPVLADDAASLSKLEQIESYLDGPDLVGLWSLHATPAMAAEGWQPVTDSEPPYTPEQLEAFRTQLITFAADLRTLAELFPEDSLLDTPVRLELTQERLESLDQEDLSSLRSAYRPYPGFWEYPAYLVGVLEAESSVARGAEEAFELPGFGRIEPEARPTVPSGDKPDLEGCNDFAGPLCDGCPPGPAGGLATVFALDMAAKVNKVVCEYLPPKLLAGSTGIPNPANIICTTIRAGLETIAAEVKYFYEKNDLCETQFERHLVLWYLDETVSSRASQKSHNAHNAYELRVAIEENLLEVLDDRVSSFQLPASQGGVLDSTDGISVRWVVSDTIRMQEAAGYTGELIRNAKDEYAAAEALLADGDYKGAYARYRKAYRAAVRVGREP